jgi:type IV pilus assembly protein PilX
VPKMKGNIQNNVLKREQGVVLFMTLVMLLIITVLGLSSVQTTSMQERMARNSRDSNLAFQSAEAAIKAAEAVVQDYVIEENFDDLVDSTAGLFYEASYNETQNWQNFDWENGAFYTADAIVGTAAVPKYLVEVVKTVVAYDDTLNLNNIGQDTGSGSTHIFRITAYGTGGTSTAHVMIQSTFGKRL